MEIIKESSFYKAILQEGRDEGREEGLTEGERKVTIDFFSDFAAKRFPGLSLEAEMEKVRDIEGLKQLVLDLDQIPDTAALRARLAELSVD